MQAHLISVLFGCSVIFSLTLHSTAIPMSDTVHQLRSAANECSFHHRAVSVVDELMELGKHPHTVCPFRVENKTLKQDHPLGNVVIDIDDIVCLGSCRNENCGGTGHSCKQLMTTLQISISNPGTGLTESIISTNVAVGCSCTPLDPGALGENIWERI